MLLTAQELLANNSKPSREKIREQISGNYCRCTGYQAIVDAIEAVAAARAGGRPPKPARAAAVGWGSSGRICTQVIPTPTLPFSRGGSRPSSRYRQCVNLIALSRGRAAVARTLRDIHRWRTWTNMMTRESFHENR
jgi:hypothetical protein